MMFGIACFLSCLSLAAASDNTKSSGVAVGLVYSGPDDFELSTNFTSGGMLLTQVCGNPLLGMGLTSDGQIVMWGGGFSPAPSDRRYTKIDGTPSYGAAIDEMGNIHRWHGLTQQSATPMDSYEFIEGDYIDVDCAVSFNWVLGTTSSGELLYVGQDAGQAYDQFPPPEGLGFTSADISNNLTGTGVFSGAAIKDGNVVTWGYEVAPPNPLDENPYVQVSINTGWGVALCADGRAVRFANSGQQNSLSTYRCVQQGPNDLWFGIDVSGRYRQQDQLVPGFDQFGTLHLSTEPSLVIREHAPAHLTANPSNAMAVIESAAPHDIVHLEPGIYSNLRFPTFGSAVQIIGAPNGETVIQFGGSGSSEIRGVSFENVQIQLLDLLYTRSVRFHTCKLERVFACPASQNSNGSPSAYVSSSFTHLKNCDLVGLEGECTAFYVNNGTVTFDACIHSGENLSFGPGRLNVWGMTVGGSTFAEPYEGLFKIQGDNVHPNVLDLTGSIVSSNSSIHGSVISVNRTAFSYCVGLRLYGGLFRENSSAFGGCIYSEVPLSVQSSTFYGNNAIVAGGAIYCRPSYSAFGGLTVKDSNFIENSANSGDAIRLFDSVAEVSGCNFARHLSSPSLLDTFDGIFLIDSTYFCENINQSLSELFAIDLGSNEFSDSCDAFDPDCDVELTGGADCDLNGVDDLCQPDSDSDGSIDPCDPDDDNDGIPDVCDVDQTGGQDCDSNGQDDLCDPDCDQDGIPDACDPICDSDDDGIPDECDVDQNRGEDCDQNGQLDSCDPDCDSDGIPDGCDAICDSDGDGIPDDCDVDQTGGADCDANGEDDSCQTDCDGDGLIDVCDNDDDNDGIPDPCDASSCGTEGPDCDSDGLIDFCELDCNFDGVPDDCQDLIDCDGNGVPDECQSTGDSDGDGVPDVCDPDDDGDGIPDECDIDTTGGSDCDANGVDDTCQEDSDGDGTIDPCDDDDDCGILGCDSDGDGILDKCDIDETGGFDCDLNGVDDLCQEDTDGDGTIDPCDPDDDGDGIPDECDIDLTGGADCNANGQDDFCEPDCDGDGLIDPCDSDRDGDGIPDECDASGCGLEGIDCDGNGVLDVCDPDCDGDGVPDACDDDDDNDGLPDECDPDSCGVLQDDCQPDGIADVCQLEGNDCNANGVPDDCEAIDPDQDCNLNGIPDVCDPDNSGDPGEPATFPSTPGCTPNGIPDDCDDCNQNGFPDVWDLDPDTAPLSFDCNGNCVPDECDIASGFSEDVDGNGQPDECQPDCNNDGIPEFEQCPFNPNGDVPCPIYPFSPCLQDCNRNGIPDCCDAIDNNNDSNGDWIPDECQTNDCNQNGIDDAIDIADGFPDCNENGIIDICDVASGSFEDCNDNLVPDVCEPSDCNANDIQDSCEIEQDPTRDANGNGILDECENACPEDLDLNGTVDFSDLLLLLGSYGPCLPDEPCPADVDQSGEVDFADILSVLGAWGDACTP